MTLDRRATSVLSCLLTFALLSFGSPAKADQQISDRITVHFEGEKIDRLVVRRDLPWSEDGIKGARVIINRQASHIKLALERLKKSGATRVEVSNVESLFSGRNWADNSEYGSNFSTWHMVGLTGSGAQKGESITFPEDPVILANYLTSIPSGTCSLLDFSLMDPTTWFQPKKCVISNPTPEDFLRAALATNLKKITWDVGSWELTALSFALEQKTHLALKNGYLYCPELSKISAGQNRILLKENHPLGGYSIAINLKNRTADFFFKGANQLNLAKGAHKFPNQDFIGFWR